MMELLYPLAPFRENKLNDADWLQMTKEQLRELPFLPCTIIGSHGYYHNDPAHIPVTNTAGEMRQTKQFPENIVNTPVNSFAFPYGTYTPDVVKEARIAGNNQLLAMDFLFV